MGKLVGEHLRDFTSLSSSQIVAALRNQLMLKDAGDHRPIGELLLDAGHITKEELDEALHRQRGTRGPEMGFPFSALHDTVERDQPHLM